MLRRFKGRSRRLVARCLDRSADDKRDGYPFGRSLVAKGRKEGRISLGQRRLPEEGCVADVLGMMSGMIVFYIET